jgi:hypothetical protein
MCRKLVAVSENRIQDMSVIGMQNCKEDLGSGNLNLAFQFFYNIEDENKQILTESFLARHDPR